MVYKIHQSLLISQPFLWTSFSNYRKIKSVCSLLKHWIIMIFLYNISCLCEVKWTNNSTFIEINIGFKIVILNLSLSSLDIKFYDLLKFWNSFSYSFLHKQIINKHHSIMTIPFFLTNHLNYEILVSLS